MDEKSREPRPPGDAQATESSQEQQSLRERTSGSLTEDSAAQKGPLETSELSSHRGQQDEDDEKPAEKSAAKGSVQKEITEWLKAVAIAALLVFVIRTFLFSPFIVDGVSMMPNFESGERVIVNKLIYDLRKPERGEVVVFHVPLENRDYIKRVIALPGDKVRLEGDELYINDVRVEEPYLQAALAEAQAAGGVFNTKEGFPNYYVQEDVVPPDTFLAFGDNRPNSKDSRMIGYIQMDELVGRADFIFWPMNQIKFVKHG